MLRASAVAAGKTENHGVAENRIFAGILSHYTVVLLYCAARANDSFHHNKRDLCVLAAVLIEWTKHKKNHEYYVLARNKRKFQFVVSFLVFTTFPAHLNWHFGTSEAQLS